MNPLFSGSDKTYQVVVLEIDIKVAALKNSVHQSTAHGNKRDIFRTEGFLTDG